MPVQIINYKNKDIVYSDHRGLSGQKLIDNIRDGCALVLKQGKDVLQLSDFRDSNLSKDAMDFARSEELKPVIKCIKKEAIVGVTGIKKMALNLYSSVTGSTAKVFNTLEEAKEYLVT